MQRYKLFWLVICFLAFINFSYAEEITILYTGQTHAMLYPCGCPVEDDGGVARRAALVKILKKNNSNTLFLDSGNFFAGGLLDQYTQNTQLDMQRTQINLKAMELMQYDAVSVGDDEFNFGVDFFQQNVKNSNLTFLSANIRSEKVIPFKIKEIKGIKIGIIGLTNPNAKYKGSSLVFIEPKEALQQALSELKKNNPDITIVLSNLEEKENLSLVNEISGIDILVTGIRTKDEPYSKTGATLIINPSWQGRKLGVLNLKLEDKKIKKYKVELLRLSDEIKDDPAVKAILPRCFSDDNCKDKDISGTCINPGGINASCKFEKQKKIEFSIIIPRNCIVCDTEPVVGYLRKHIPGLTPTYLYYPDTNAKKLIKDLKITGLPAYIFKEGIRQEKGFAGMQQNLEARGSFYLLRPQIGGLSYLLDREKQEGKVDLFISLYDHSAATILEMMKDSDPQVHFLATAQENKFNAMKGTAEVEECLRSVCIKKYYPEKSWDYLICRARNINSSWWDSCLGQDDAYAKIKTCAMGAEGQALLKENIQLNQELRIVFGPAYLINNQEIFTTEGLPSKEKFKKIFKTK